MSSYRLKLAQTMSTSEIDTFVSSTGNFNFFTLDKIKKLDNNAVVGMSGKFCNGVDLAGQRSLRAWKRQQFASEDRDLYLKPVCGCTPNACCELNVPCVVHWGFLWFIPPSSLNVKLDVENIRISKYHEVTNLVIEAAIKAPYG